MRNRRAPSELPPTASEPPFRLRYLLLALAVGGLGLTVYPRMKAAWRLADKTTAAANYALCMAGPTGPVALTENAEEFKSLLRRRLLTAEDVEQPFANCRSLFEQVFEKPGNPLLSAAGEFQVYSGKESAVAPALDELVPRVAELHALGEAAWPFTRKSPLEMIRPSAHAKEAPHPVEFPRPVAGSGLPSADHLYRTAWQQGGTVHLALGQGAELTVLESVDGGQVWTKGSLSAPGLGEHAGRCAANDSRQSFLFEHEDGKIAVVSLAGDDPVGRSVLRIRAEPHKSSCDSNTALFVAQPPDNEAPYVVLCQHAGRCGKLQVPVTWTSGSFDIAQLDGVAVVATLTAGVVRVRSSRDRGKTWTPATIAMDVGAVGSNLEVHLQPTGSNLLLWVSDETKRKVYPLAASEDYGASFRGAEVTPARSEGKGLAKR
jgi:hypothetical protein